MLRFAPTDLLGDGAESFSALNGLRETALRRPGGRFWIEGGNERLPQAFAARLGGRIRYGAELVRIAMTDLPIQLVMHATAAQPGPRGILDTYITGAEARRLAALEPARRLAEVVAQASRLYPELPAHFEGGTSVCWDDEPWTRGAYAYFAPGAVGTLLPHVARPEGRVHFAGDHTSSRPGWMQGALSSGLRAAAEVAAG